MTSVVREPAASTRPVVGVVTAVTPVVEVDAVFAVPPGASPQPYRKPTTGSLLEACKKPACKKPARSLQLGSPHGSHAEPSRLVRDVLIGADLLLLGGAEGIRTPDPLHAMEVRYQLRYSPVLRE